MSKINSSPPVTAQPFPSQPSPADQLHRDLATAVITFHEAGARKLGMSAAERKTLGYLAEMGVATPGQLATATGLTTGAITGIVDRLEKAGYARRKPNPDDRRSLLIEAQQIDKVMRIQGPVFGALSVAMAELSAKYTVEELAVIHGYLAATTEILRGQTRRLKGS